MEPASLIMTLIVTGLKLWENHSGKKLTAADLEAMIAEVDEATPEAVKAQARARLGLPTNPS